MFITRLRRVCDPLLPLGRPTAAGGNCGPQALLPLRAAYSSAARPSSSCMSMQAHHTLGGRAARDVRRHGLPGQRPLTRGSLEMIVDMDAGDFEHTADIFVVARYTGLESIVRGSDLMAGQHRGQYPHHSAAHRSHDVVERGGMLFCRAHPIESCMPPCTPSQTGSLTPSMIALRVGPFFSVISMRDG